MTTRLPPPITKVTLETVATLPRRHPLLHWSAFAGSIVSFAILAVWFLATDDRVPLPWVVLDAVLCAFFALELSTRSGLRWSGVRYLRFHLFDVISLVPALAFVHHGLPIESGWMWLIFVARATRVVDRLLGDGFVQRNTLALVEGFEEEITDRVVLRILNSIESSVEEGRIGHAIAEALARNKQPVLEKVRLTHPQRGFGPGLAHVLGLDKALEDAEERVYDAVVEVLGSPEVDKAIEEALVAALSDMRSGMTSKEWKKHLGIRPSSLRTSKRGLKTT